MNKTTLHEYKKAYKTLKEAIENDDQELFDNARKWMMATCNAYETLEDPTKPKPFTLRRPLFISACKGKIKVEFENCPDEFADCTAELAEALRPYLKD